LSVLTTALQARCVMALSPEPRSRMIARSSVQVVAFMSLTIGWIVGVQTDGAARFGIMQVLRRSASRQSVRALRLFAAVCGGDIPRFNLSLALRKVALTLSGPSSITAGVVRVRAAVLLWNAQVQKRGFRPGCAGRRPSGCLSHSRSWRAGRHTGKLFPLGCCQLSWRDVRLSPSSHPLRKLNRSGCRLRRASGMIRLVHLRGCW
jgi:hypothetical protein